MLIALGVTGGIGAYKAVEVARGLQKRGHEVVAVMTAIGDALRRARHVRGHHPPPRHHRSVRAGRERRHRAHRPRLDHRSAAHRAGHGEHPRQARERHRRRFPVDALHRDARARAGRAGDEHADVRARGRAANLDTLAARGVRFVEPGEGYLACGWIGKGRLAEPDEIVAAAEAMLSPTGRSGGSGSSSPPGRPTRISIRFATSAIDRAAGWVLRSPPKPRGAAPR